MDNEKGIVFYVDSLMHRQYSSLRLLAAIPEEPSSHLFNIQDDEDDQYILDNDYILDLRSGVTESWSMFPTPKPVPVTPTRRSLFPERNRRPATRPPRTRRDKDGERECGICFELAVSPVRTLCCAHIFCAEHILSWLDGPASDGRCPTCRSPSSATGMELLALGHPAILHLVPRAPPPSRSPSPSPPDSPSPAMKQRCYAAYPTVPLPSSSPSPSSSASDTSVEDEAEAEDEDKRDFPLPVLVHARALQTRRHVAHRLASVLGVRGVYLCVARVALWVLVMGVLAGRGRWGLDGDTDPELDVDSGPA